MFLRLRSRGVTVLITYQAHTALRRIYGETATEGLGQCTNVIYLRQADVESAEYAAKDLGHERGYEVLKNVGFSGANNAGAQIARGRLLLLLNSDVLPDRRGWLSEMVEFIDRSPNIGAVAPKLLFEDDSIQHAGLYFERPDGEGLWSNEHYFKGLHRSLPAACTARAVPAVTAADCSPMASCSTASFCSGGCAPQARPSSAIANSTNILQADERRGERCMFAPDWLWSEQGNRRSRPHVSTIGLHGPA